MENELIKIETREGFGRCVSLRELHEGLGIKTQFTKWAIRMIEYGFTKNIDFILISQKRLTNNPKNPFTEQTDYIITIDMAKEICMIQRSDIGREFRKYFIECEKQLKEVKQKPQLSPQEQLALQLFNGGIDAITAHKQLLTLETKELNERIIEQQETIEEKETEIKQLSPLAEILIKRFEKGNNIGWTDITKTFGLKRGQASKWAVSNGYIYKSKKDVTSKGDKYFQRYLYNGHKCICITPEGVQLIEQHLDEIKNI
ncbi:MAG: antA/AntB antirepressor family protein [Terrisporobacter sp.]|uniref:antA/AntB antirepressor family protein n=1 Tax=Terrisporobacter sp. TaxID=1965305 RepID=UPI002A920D57|nr:antA/AntB antirepressor family protein [Terrisporobacter sp.]MDY6154697.1 antA/AntB antirepressor family protein [Terrisporobacter sp.]